MRNKSGRIISVIAAALVAASTAIAGPAVEVVKQLPAADKGLDLAVPDSPGLSVLGLDPETATRPTTPRELAAQLLNGVDANGNFQSGVAVDTAPYMLIKGKDFTIGEYRDSQMKRILARTQVSFATAKGVSDDDEAVRIGLGVRTVIWDEGDPRMKDELWDCFDAILASRPRLIDAKYQTLQRELTTSGQSVRAASEAAEDKFSADFKEFVRSKRSEAEACREKLKQKYWNASGLELAAAPSAIQKPNDGDALDFGGATFWGSLAYGFEDVPALSESSQALLHVRYRAKEAAPVQDAGGKFRDQDTFVAALRVRVGRPKWNVSLEGDYVRTDPKDARVDDSYRVTVGTDLQLMDNVWLNIGVGGTGGRNDDDRLFVLAAVKWGSKTFSASQFLEQVAKVTK